MTLSKNFCCKVQYYLVTIACVILSLYQVTVCTQKFLKFPITPNYDLKHLDEIDFPEMTLCLMNGYDFDALEKFGLKLEEYRDGLLVSPNNSALGPEEIFEAVTFNIEDWLSVDYNSSRAQRRNKEKDSLRNNKDGKFVPFGTFRMEMLGRCVTIEPDENAHKREVAVSVGEKGPVVFLIHQRGELADSEVHTLFVAEFRATAAVSLSLEISDFSEIKKGSCLKIEDGYNFDACVLRSVNKKIMEVVGCTVPWAIYTPDLKGTGDYDTNICRDRDKARKALEMYRDLALTEKQTESCKKYCKKMDVTVKRLVEVSLENTSSNLASAIIYFPGTVRISKLVWSYTFLSMLAEIGGYAGILLGISVLQISGSMENFFGRK